MIFEITEYSQSSDFWCFYSPMCIARFTIHRSWDFIIQLVPASGVHFCRQGPVIDQTRAAPVGGRIVDALLVVSFDQSWVWPSSHFPAKSRDVVVMWEHIVVKLIELFNSVMRYLIFRIGTRRVVRAHRANLPALSGWEKIILIFCALVLQWAGECSMLW